MRLILRLLQLHLPSTFVCIAVKERFQSPLSLPIGFHSESVSLRLRRACFNTFEYVLQLFLALEELKCESLFIDGGDKTISIFIFRLYLSFFYLLFLLPIFFNFQKLFFLEFSPEAVSHFLFICI